MAQACSLESLRAYRWRAYFVRRDLRIRTSRCFRDLHWTFLQISFVSAGQECPQNRRKNDCSERRFGRQQTQGLRRRRRRRCSFQEASASLEGAYPPHTVLSHRSDGFRSDRLRLPQPQLVSAARHRSVKSACRRAPRLSLPTRTPRTTGTPSTGLLPSQTGPDSKS